MTKFYLIRHGYPDYSYAEEHNFIGHGFDLSPLSEQHIADVIETSKDTRLKQAQIIISSPYTRALQTAAIISKEIGKNIIVNYSTIILVAHKMLFQSICDCGDMKPAEIFEMDVL